MAKPLEIRVGYLIAEFLAHTFIFLGLLQPARTVTALFYKPFAYGSHHFFIRIQSYLHDTPSFYLYSVNIIPDIFQKSRVPIIFSVI